jgi:hypothetical protein
VAALASPPPLLLPLHPPATPLPPPVLQEIKSRAEHPWFGKNGRFAVLNKLQLCPIIWAIILGLLAVFVVKVMGTEHMFGFGSGDTTDEGAANAAAAAAVAAAHAAAAAGGGGRAAGAAARGIVAAVDAGGGGGGRHAPPGPAPPGPGPPGPAPPRPPRPPGAGKAQMDAFLSSGGMQFFAWTCLLSAGAGLALLYNVTTCDPGYIRRGAWDAGSGKHAGGGGGKSGGKARDGGGEGTLIGVSAAAQRGVGGGGGGSMVENRGGGGGGGPGGGGGGGESHPLLRTGSDSGACGHALLDCPALWAGHWGQICVTCRIVRPLRAKHCAVTDRCIEVFDHYCPWVGNAIGKRNRHTFLVFLWLELYALLSSVGCAVAALRAYITFQFWSDRMAWVIGFVIIDAFITISVAVLSVAQASQVARNVTTNELANWHRCERGGSGGGGGGKRVGGGGWRAWVGRAGLGWARRPPRRGKSGPRRAARARRLCADRLAIPSSPAAAAPLPTLNPPCKVPLPAGLRGALPQPLQPHVLPQLRRGVPPRRGARRAGDAAPRPRCCRCARPRPAAAHVMLRGALRPLPM